MLSQRITLFAHSLQNTSSPAHQDDLRETLDRDLSLFLHSHDALRSRSYLRPEHRDIYVGTDSFVGLNEMVGEFEALVGTIRQNVIAEQTVMGVQTRATLSQLHDLATGALLRQLNTSVGEFERAVAAAEARDTRVANAAFFAAIGLLLFEALFIFWPAHRAIIGTFSDLRLERRKADRLRKHATEIAEDRAKALATKSQFFNHLSHELRTPLNGVVAGAELLQDADLTDDDRETLSIITQASEELADKIEQLLQASSQEQVAPARDATEFTLKGALGDLISDMAGRARAKHLRFDHSSDINENRPLIGHPEILKDALKAVLDNGIKFTTAGEVTLDVTALDLNNELKLLFVVEDTGPGVSNEVRDALFEPFAPQMMVQNKPHDGLGLSLYHVRAALAAVGGEIAFASRRNGGSRFSIIFPVKTKLQENSAANSP